MAGFYDADKFFIYKRKGTGSDPFIPKEETHRITNNKVVLNEIPNEFNGVEVEGSFYETKGIVNNTNEYRVDYQTGYVYFHDSQEGVEVTFNYLGEGWISMPSSRVYVEEKNGSPTQTLKDVINQGKLKWLQPVDTYADIATAYPAPEYWSIVQVLSDGKYYRYENGQWKWTQTVNNTQVDEINNKIGDPILIDKRTIAESLKDKDDRLVANQNQLDVLSDDRLSVLDYAVKKDGINNTSTEMQNAFNNANGRKVIIPKGVYIVDNINVPDNVNIISEKGAVLKALNGTSNSVLILGNNCTIQGLEIDGNKSNKTGGNGIFVSQKTGVKIINCTVRNTYEKGIKLNNSTDFIVDGNTVVDAGVGENNAQAIECVFSNRGRISNNFVNNCRHGIQFWGGDSALTSTTGLFDLTITGNIVKNVRGGIWGSLGERITIQGNTIEFCSDVGIDFEGCKYSTAIGNTVKDCSSAALAVFYGGESLVFEGNTVLQNSGYGRAFRVFGTKTVKNVIIKGNVLRTYNQIAIYNDAGFISDSIIDGNVIIVDSVEYAIRILETKKISVTNNRITVSSNKGIGVYGGNECVISNNTIETLSDTSTGQNGNGGIYLYWQNDTNPCQLNTVSNNIIKGFNISINDNCWGVTFSYNWIRNNRLKSIWRKTGDYRGRIENNVDYDKPITDIVANTY